LVLKNIAIEAKGLWFGKDSSGIWLLRDVNLRIFEGDLVVILGDSTAANSALLRLIGFRHLPAQGRVYFQGRLVGYGGIDELIQMQTERVWYLKGGLGTDCLILPPDPLLTAVLLDEPLEQGKLTLEPSLLEQICALKLKGVAV